MIRTMVVMKVMMKVMKMMMEGEAPEGLLLQEIGGIWEEIMGFFLWGIPRFLGRGPWHIFGEKLVVFLRRIPRFVRGRKPRGHFWRKSQGFWGDCWAFLGRGHGILLRGESQGFRGEIPFFGGAILMISGGESQGFFGGILGIFFWEGSRNFWKVLRRGLTLSSPPPRTSSCAPPCRSWRPRSCASRRPRSSPGTCPQVSPMAPSPRPSRSPPRPRCPLTFSASSLRTWRSPALRSVPTRGFVPSSAAIMASAESRTRRRLGRTNRPAATRRRSSSSFGDSVGDIGEWGVLGAAGDRFTPTPWRSWDHGKDTLGTVSPPRGCPLPRAVPRVVAGLSPPPGVSPVPTSVTFLLTRVPMS